MSANKSKYFDVTTLTTVVAPNMATAVRIANGQKVSGTKVLSSVSTVERVSAQEAREWAASISSN